MDPSGLAHRPAGPGDRAALASFTCESADPRLERWIRNDALDHQQMSTPSDDFRLIIIYQDDGALVAVAAHQRNEVAVDAQGDPVPGTYLVLVAIADRFRDAVAPDGRHLISVVLEVTFDDIRERKRGPCVSMMTYRGNSDGEAVIARLGATRIGVANGVDDVYVLFVE
jgi:hypothetical protein